MRARPQLFAAGVCEGPDLSLGSMTEPFVAFLDRPACGIRVSSIFAPRLRPCACRGCLKFNHGLPLPQPPTGLIRLQRKWTLAVSNDPKEGLRAIFLANRETLRRFLLARGAGDDADDLLQDLWLKISRAQSGPIAAPMSYLYRTANTLMIDRFRSVRQSVIRDADWADSQSGAIHGVSDTPSAERIIQSRQAAANVEEALADLPSRAVQIFRRSRIDGLTQREIAAEMGVSASTVESDLRSVYRALAELRERLDEE